MPIELYLNGAFFTGAALDSSALLATSYGSAQERVADALNGQAPGEWRYDRVIDGPSTLRFSVQGKYSTLIPVSFVSRAGAAVRDHLLQALETDGGVSDPVATAWDQLDLAITNIEIDFFDIGVGVVAASLLIDPRVPLTLGDLREKVEHVTSALVPAFNVLVSDTVAVFETGIKQLPTGTVLPTPWFQQEGPLFASPLNPSPTQERPVGLTPPGQLLWLHRTYVFEACSVALEEQVDALLPSTFARESFPGLLFIPGIGSTVIVCRQPGGRHSQCLTSVQDILSLMDLQWAYIAAVMEIDRTLFRRLNQFAVSARRASAATLERESQSVLALYDKVRLFRAAINSVIIDLGGGSRGHWDLMARVQTLPEILSSIDDKLDALREACQTMLAEASAKRQRRIALTVDIFAGFSVAASITAVIAFLVDPSLDASTVGRIAVLVLAFLVVTTALIGNRLARGETGGDPPR